MSKEVRFLDPVFADCSFELKQLFENPKLDDEIEVEVQFRGNGLPVVILRAKEKSK